MYGSRIVTGLAVVLTGIALLFAVLALVYNLVFVTAAVVFGLSAYFVWYHASGRLARRLYRGVEARAETGRADNVGAGPRADWEVSREREAGSKAGREAWDAAGREWHKGGGQPGRGQTATHRQSERAAYAALDLSPGADERAVRAAYRRKVKEVHPDQPDGDEDRFKEVQAAYERLSD